MGAQRLRVFAILAVLFVVLPWLELVVLIRLWRQVGLLSATAVVLGTGVLGAWLARQQGVRAWGAVRLALREGRLPSHEIVEAVLVLAAGLLLITPGLLTDAVGFLLLLPWVRVRAGKLAIRRLRGQAGFTFVAAEPEMGECSGSAGDPEVIDVQPRDVEIE